MLISSKINKGINGIIKIPGDKSISHRSIIIPAISKGTTEISDILMSEDVMHTLDAFVSMGINIKKIKNKIIIEGKGLNGLQKPKNKINLGNSGTSARLLIGLLSSQKFDTTIIGDKSLSNRPMKRITDPLELMNGKFNSNNGSLPLQIYGRELKNITYEIPMPSAQVKSGLILAALNTEKKTSIIENFITRDHTEIMLNSFGADIDIEKRDEKTIINIIGKKELMPKNIFVPSDLSSSAFFIVAALINKNSNILLKNININKTRDGILKALSLMNANIEIFNKTFLNNENVADIRVSYSKLKGCHLNSEMAKYMIDEYPILAIAASFAESPSLFQGLGELKVKESNRLELIRKNLINCGVYCEVNNDELFIDPSKKSEIKNNIIQTDFDHRIAMSFAVMGSVTNEDLNIMDSKSIDTSFPTFIKNFNHSGGNLIE